MITIDHGIPIPINKDVSIYILKCPIDDKVKYVGRAINLEKRYQNHLRGGNRKISKWIKLLASQGLKPLMIEIEHVKGVDRDDREKYWIDYCEKTVGGLFNIAHNPSLKPGYVFPITYLK